MPHTHRINDQFQTDAAGVLSDAQFDKLVALLDDQHKAIEAALKPIHDIATLLLADRTASDSSKTGS
jgi:hypothetical protein